MGYFSKCCAKTHLPVLCADSFWGNFAPRLCKVVMLAANGDRITREYDGFGCGDVLDFDACKMVLADAYNNETFAQLGESEYEPGQGVFHSRGLIATLKDVPSLPSYDAYCKLLKRYEAEETTIRNALLCERGINCDTGLGADIANALDNLAAGFEQVYEQLLERNPKMAELLPVGYEDAKKYAKLFDDALVARTTSKAKMLIANLLATGSLD